MIPWRVICWLTPAAAVPGGRWIPYSAAQVALRRAARLVCVVIGGMGGSVPSVIPPDAVATIPFAPIALYVPQDFFVPNAFPPVVAQPEAFSETQVPEPSSLAVLALGVAVLALGVAVAAMMRR